MPRTRRSVAKAPDKRPAPLPAASCPLVAVGASAGGLEALIELLKHLPAKTGFAFAFVQHLNPKQPSQLSKLLARATTLRVSEATEAMPVEKNSLYIIPHDMDMSIAGGMLHLSPRTAESGRHLPIDHFFCSVAAECGNRAIGVVLSGNANDGTLGLKAIKAAGGITFAQDEATARCTGMPRSAVEAGYVDFILPPKGIAEELIRIGSNDNLAAPLEKDPPSGNGLKKIYALLRGATGVDFSQYKQSTLNRRIRRRMVLHRFDHLDEYGAYLEIHPEEVESLYEDSLIHVTSFFREPEVFEALLKYVLPALAKSGRGESAIRVWHPGCATGEEAYSFAIALAEFFDGKPKSPTIQIFATDVSEHSIARARKGIFEEGIQKDVSASRLRRFFMKVDRGWQICRTIRDMCVFARQNLIKDPPFSNLDLIVCRNVLIYFDQPSQRRMIPMFHSALRPGGFLLLGSAESIGTFSDLFESLDPKSKLFAKRIGTDAHHLHLVEPESRAPGEGGAHPPPENEIWSRLDVQKAADRLLMARYCPPAIVVGENMDIIQFRGAVAPFVEPASGEASLNLYRMLRPALQIELRAAIARAKSSGAVVRRENVELNGGGQARRVNLEVSPLGAGLRERCFIVLFEEVAPPSSDPEPPQKGGRARDQRVLRLEKELAGSREQIQSMVEEHEVTTEELRSANEEIQSSNEELQSTNEELETAKEELQSANEELTTLNEELKNSNLELSRLNDDLANLLRSVSIPMVMLDRNLRVRRFTPIAQKLLKLLPGDIGRSITDLRGDIEVPGLEAVAREVIGTLGTREMELRDHHGRWHLLQLRPYETADNKITGVVLIFFDIDAHKRAREKSELAAAYAEAFLETVRNPLILLDASLRVKRASAQFCKTFRLSLHEMEDRPLYELGDGEWDLPKLRSLLETVLPKKARVNDFELELDFRQVGRKRLLVNARRIERDVNGEPLILLSLEELPMKVRTTR